MLKHVAGNKKGYSIDECLEVMRALSDKTRQEIIMIFSESKEYCANDIAARFTLSRPAISHHLNLMRRAGLLNSRKSGKEVYYSFNKEYVLSLINSMTDLIKTCC